ncbi:NAD(P)/FAD-dependent oxidoreductase [Dongia sp.]|uniref:NAD(P)/FAD-dependent oxidoreductase n=1 Tax=Dongia sp. TaxID=1977262 RepID=UPI0035B30EE3
MKEPNPVAEGNALPHVVILGAGFAGLTAAQGLARARCRITLIDRRNYHLFQPLLYQVATAALSPAEIAVPIRSILRKQKNVSVLMGRVQGIDRTRRLVMVDQSEVSYDQLIVATGARHGYFGHDDWEAVAPGLKKIDDATQIRRQLLLAFEQAESTSDQELRKALLTFVVIGGGPTGVELAGAIAELARQALVEDFREIDPSQARIVLVEAGSRLLAAFPESLSRAAFAALTELGVEVLLGQAVTNCSSEGVCLGSLEIPSRSVIWAAGVAASPAARWLGCERDRAGRAIVGADLSLPNSPEIFVIGDTASVMSDGRPVPGLAPAAKQMGAYVAKVLLARVNGKEPPPAFRYKHLGSLATIGRQKAVADFGRLQLRGRLAWFLWGIVHVIFLIGVRSRVQVALQWLWAYATYERGARLITSPGSSGD